MVFRTQTPHFGPSDPPLPPRSGKEDAFMRWAKQKIISTEKHPLKFLINETTKNWHSRKNTRQPGTAAEVNYLHPPVHPGHVFTRARLGDISEERFCLQDADRNIENARDESRGVAIQLSVVEVGSIPVELGTVKMWENTGKLAPSTPDSKRIISRGWATINDPGKLDR